MMFPRPEEEVRTVIAVKNTSTAYINTGVKWTVGYTYTIKVDASNVASTFFVMGARSSTVAGQPTNDAFGVLTHGSPLYYKYDCWSRSITNVPPSVGVVVITCTATEISVDGIVKDTGNKTTSGTKDIFLFCMNTNGTASTQIAASIYEFKVEDGNGNVVQHLTPAIVRGVVGFTDQVSGNFYSSPNGVSFEAVYQS